MFSALTVGGCLTRVTVVFTCGEQSPGRAEACDSPKLSAVPYQSSLLFLHSKDWLVLFMIVLSFKQIETTERNGLK